MTPSTTAAPRGPGFFRRLALRFGTVGELVHMLASSGRWWLLPLVAVFVLGALVLGVVQVVEYAAPFVYTIF